MSAQKGLLILLTLALAYFARAVFVPVFLAIFLTILLDPFVIQLHKLRIGRIPGSIIITFFFSLLAVGAGWIIYQSVSGIAVEFPVYADRIKGLLSGMHLTTERIEESTRTLGLGGGPVNPDIQQVQVVDKYPAWVDYLVRWVGSLYDVATVAIFVPLLLLYMLFERDNLLESFNALVGKHCYLPKLNRDLPKIIRAFVSGNVVTGFLLILAHAAVFKWMNLDNWLPLAVLTGFLNLVPLIGAPLAIVLPFAQAIIQYSTAYPFVVIAVALVTFHLVAGNFVLPFFMSSRVNVNSVSLLFGLLFWGWLWGAMGFLLAIPMTALVKTFLESNQSTFAISNLLAARPRHVIPWAERAATRPPGAVGSDTFSEKQTAPKKKSGIIPKNPKSDH